MTSQNIVRSQEEGVIRYGAVREAMKVQRGTAPYGAQAMRDLHFAVSKVDEAFAAIAEYDLPETKYLANELLNRLKNDECDAIDDYNSKD